MTDTDTNDHFLADAPPLQELKLQRSSFAAADPAATGVTRRIVVDKQSVSVGEFIRDAALFRSDLSLLAGAYGMERSSIQKLLKDPALAEEIKAETARIKERGYAAALAEEVLERAIPVLDAMIQNPALPPTDRLSAVREVLSIARPKPKNTMKVSNGATQNVFTFAGNLPEQFIPPGTVFPDGRIHKEKPIIDMHQQPITSFIEAEEVPDRLHPDHKERVENETTPYRGTHTYVEDEDEDERSNEHLPNGIDMDDIDFGDDADDPSGFDDDIPISAAPEMPHMTNCTQDDTHAQTAAFIAQMNGIN